VKLNKTNQSVNKLNIKWKKHFFLKPKNPAEAGLTLIYLRLFIIHNYHRKIAKVENIAATSRISSLLVVVYKPCKTSIAIQRN
jgi:hypothetical protein